MSTTDTIAAIATPPGEGGVGIVRISGSRVWKIADEMFQGLELPSRAKGGTFLHGKVTAADGAEIDEVLCLIFRAPKSYTGEDTIELQGHGGPIVLKKILRRCLDAGARMAEPGEFTRRAFLHGRLDLTQAEAVEALIHARNDAEYRAATAALTAYLALIATAAFAGGSSMALLSLSHRATQVLLSFTGGVLLGVGMLHLLPHAALELGGNIDTTMGWALAGFFVMFLLERAFHSHAHHAADSGCGHADAHHHHEHHPPVPAAAYIAIGRAYFESTPANLPSSLSIS